MISETLKEPRNQIDFQSKHCIWTKGQQAYKTFWPLMVIRALWKPINAVILALIGWLRLFITPGRTWLIKHKNTFVDGTVRKSNLFRSFARQSVTICLSTSTLTHTHTHTFIFLINSFVYTTFHASNLDLFFALISTMPARNLRMPAQHRPASFSILLPECVG